MRGGARAEAGARLAGLVLAAFALYAGAAQLVSSPRVFPDEIIYGEAAGSLAAGEGLRVRGERYEYGPLYPAAIAPAFWLFEDRAEAYEALKVINALLFALAAVPVYLLARRLLPPGPSLGAAALSLAIPSSLFVGLVMTETLAYLAAAWLLLAIARALERPTPARQLVVLAGALAAYAARPQLAALYLTYLAALPLLWLLLPERVPRTRAAALRLWPTAASLLAGTAVFALPLLGASSPLGAYQVLWRSYDPLVVARWLLYHLADLELYLAVIPLAAAPAALVALAGRRGGRAPSPQAAAFCALFLAANAVGLLVVAVFSSTEHGFDRLHDRNVFYLVPLWLVLLAAWLARGMPRPRLALAAGAALALALPALLPFRHVSSSVGVDVVTSALWGRIQEATGTGGLVHGRSVLALFVLALVAAAVALPRRLAALVPAAVAAVFLATAVLAWERQVDAPENAVFAGAHAGERTWIDDRLPPGARVTKLYVDTGCGSALQRHALYLSEFFNARVHEGAFVGDTVPDGLPSAQVDVARDGRLLVRGDGPLAAEYVYTQPEVPLAGEPLARGTAAGLVLWRVQGPVRVRGARSNAALRTAGC